MTKIYIGIDVGKKGALSAIDTDGNIIKSFEYKDDIQSMIQEIQELTFEYSITMCIIEKVHSMPNQGAPSTFTFGENFGMWQGIMYAFGIPFDLVRPQQWMKDTGVPPKSDKKAIAQCAQRLFPKADLYTPRGRLLDGVSDSLMMAHYARLKY